MLIPPMPIHACMQQTHLIVIKYSLRFKIKVTFGHKLHCEIKVTFCKTNWNVANNNVNVVVDVFANEQPSQLIVYTCLTIDIWT